MQCDNFHKNYRSTHTGEAYRRRAGLVAEGKKNIGRTDDLFTPCKGPTCRHKREKIKELDIKLKPFQITQQRSKTRKQTKLERARWNECTLHPNRREIGICIKCEKRIAETEEQTLALHITAPHEEKGDRPTRFRPLYDEEDDDEEIEQQTQPSKQKRRKKKGRKKKRRKQTRKETSPLRESSDSDAEADEEMMQCTTRQSHITYGRLDKTKSLPSASGRTKITSSRKSRTAKVNSVPKSDICTGNAIQIDTVQNDRVTDRSDSNIFGDHPK